MQKPPPNFSPSFTMNSAVWRRYRWPDEVRDEVLARLLKLNAERAVEEKLAGKAVAAAETKGRKGAAGKHSRGVAPAQRVLIPPPQMELFG